MQESGRQLLILLADDQPFFFTYHRNILTAKGFRVLTAADGEEGLRPSRPGRRRRCSNPPTPTGS